MSISISKHLVFILFMLGCSIVNPVYSKENKRETYEQLDLFGQVFDLIKSKYVEEVESKELIEAAINGMLSSLDPHSGFLVPKSYDDMQVDTKGSFGGLGIEVTQQDGFVKVVSPMDDTPAFKAGVLAGDFITFVDDKPMLGLTLSEAVEIMRGPVGSSIKLTIVREGLEDPIEVEVTRAVIKLTAAKVRVDNDVVIMRVTTFNEQTIPNLEDGMKATMEKIGSEPKGFILDLRNNPGGLLSVAISVTDLFLDQGEIVSTRDREGKGDRYKASKGDITKGKPIVILINAGSASASEIVAGALQDHRRAIVLGTKSFGKGSVQSVLPMGQSGGIRLTTARYYTPSGRSIQALGVTPDVFLEFKKAEENEDEEKRRTFSEADLEGALSNDSLTDAEKEMLRKEEISIQEANKRRNKDNQLAHAIDLIEGLSVLSIKE